MSRQRRTPNAFWYPNPKYTQDYMHDTFEELHTQRPDLCEADLVIETMLELIEHDNQDLPSTRATSSVFNTGAK